MRDPLFKTTFKICEREITGYFLARHHCFSFSTSVSMKPLDVFNEGPPLETTFNICERETTGYFLTRHHSVRRDVMQ